MAFVGMDLDNGNLNKFCMIGKPVGGGVKPVAFIGLAPYRSLFVS